MEENKNLDVDFVEQIFSPTVRGLIVGESSFIGKNINDIFMFDKCDYKNFKSYDLKNYDVVLNCSLNPLYKINSYQEEIDVDFEIGKQVCEKNVHYVMLSTSKVYGQHNDLKTFNEESIIEPFDYYGENKYITEQKLLSNFKENVTILRGSNIFGYEYGRNSFMGYCMSQLVNEGKITLTINKNTKRDFLFVADAAEIIQEVCIQRPKGIFNLSSNYGLEIERLIQNLIDGYKYGGKIEIKDSKFDRQFILDNSKLKKALDIEIGPFFFDIICYNLGQQLCKTY